MTSEFNSVGKRSNPWNNFRFFDQQQTGFDFKCFKLDQFWRLNSENFFQLLSEFNLSPDRLPTRHIQVCFFEESLIPTKFEGTCKDAVSRFHRWLLTNIEKLID